MTFRLAPKDIAGFERYGAPEDTTFGIVFPLVRRSDGRRLAVYFDLKERCFVPSTNSPKGMGGMQDLHPDSLEPMVALLSPEDIAYATARAIEYTPGTGGAA